MSPAAILCTVYSKLSTTSISSESAQDFKSLGQYKTIKSATSVQDVKTVRLHVNKWRVVEPYLPPLGVIRNPATKSYGLYAQPRVCQRGIVSNKRRSHGWTSLPMQRGANVKEAVGCGCRSHFTNGRPFLWVPLGDSIVDWSDLVNVWPARKNNAQGGDRPLLTKLSFERLHLMDASSALACSCLNIAYYLKIVILYFNFSCSNTCR